MEVVDGTLVFTTTVVNGTSWDVQANQAPLRLENEPSTSSDSR